MSRKISSLLLIFAIFFGLVKMTHASLLPIPQIQPGLAPTVQVIKDKKIRRNTQQNPQKIENTPDIQWQMIKKGKSIEVYEDSTGMIWVQKINLGSGTKIGSIFEFHGYDEINGEPTYTRFSPREELRKFPEKPFSYINGQFFDPRKKSTPFSFGFKLRDTILTAGADNRAEQKNIFVYSTSGAQILPYSWDTFASVHAEFAIVNLSMSESHESERYMGRTYICLLAPDISGSSKIVMTFSFMAATESYAANILHSWGCQDQYTSKLDSSGSSVFGLGEDVHHGYSHRGAPDYRKIPQIITFHE